MKLVTPSKERYKLSFDIFLSCYNSVYSLTNFFMCLCTCRQVFHVTNVLIWIWMVIYVFRSWYSELIKSLRISIVNNINPTKSYWCFILVVSNMVNEMGKEQSECAFLVTNGWIMSPETLTISNNLQKFVWLCWLVVKSTVAVVVIVLTGRIGICACLWSYLFFCFISWLATSFWLVLIFFNFGFLFFFWFLSFILHRLLKACCIIWLQRQNYSMMTLLMFLALMNLFLNSVLTCLIDGLVLCLSSKF